MFKIKNKYGKIHFNGKSIDIDQIDIDEIDEHLERLELKRMKIIEEQNEYLSQIISK